MYKFLCRHTFLFLLCIYLKVEFLGHIVVLCLAGQKFDLSEPLKHYLKVTKLRRACLIELKDTPPVDGGVTDFRRPEYSY